MIEEVATFGYLIHLHDIVALPTYKIHNYPSLSFIRSVER